jgi:hypothetical protein
VNGTIPDGEDAYEFGDAAIPPPPIGVLLSEVEPEVVSWLWPGRVAFGKITMLDGDPGLGKSTMALDVAARVSSGGVMPGCHEPIAAAGVVILTAEDGLADTVRPRLDAAGADVERVVALQVNPATGDPLMLPDHMDLVQAAIERVSAKLVVIDPIMAFLSEKVDGHKDQSVRRPMAHLMGLAERTGAAVLVVRHLNKGAGGSAMYRGTGSIAFIGAARSGLMVGRDPDDPERRVLASVKCNLAKQPESLAFRVEAADGASRIVWEGSTPLTADDLVSVSSDSEQHGAVAEAEAFLRAVLRDGPRLVKDVKRLAREADISERTLRRAKDNLKVIAYQERGTKHPGWTWKLPDGQVSTPAGDPDVGHLMDSWPSDAATCGDEQPEAPDTGSGCQVAKEPDGYEDIEEID